MTLDFLITFMCTVVLLVGYAIGRIDGIACGTWFKRKIKPTKRNR